MSHANQVGVFRANVAHTKTYMPTKEYTYKWTVENFSQLPSEEIIVSPHFYLEPDEEYYAAIKRNFGNVFWFYFHRCAEEPKIKLIYTITASNLNGDEIIQKRSTVQFTKINKCHDLFPNGAINITNIVNDVLLITLELNIMLPLITFNMETDVSKEEFSRQTLYTLLKNYKDIYVNHKHTDVTLRVEKQETLSAHKAILSARSPVFERMFEQEGIVEHRDGIVDIDDVSMSTLNELVDFLYSGELIDYDFDTAMEVYYAADKYSVMDLRQYCGHRITSSLTRLNAGRALILAEQHDDQVLWEKVCKYIVHHYEQDKRKK